MPRAQSIHQLILELYPEQNDGKGCINFRERDEINLNGLAEVIRHAIEHPKD